jgi:uncharacterized protein YndB with AHSA1/START domain
MSSGGGGEDVRGEIHIEASQATVFALLSDAVQMRSWLAPLVDANPRPGGVFRATDHCGLSIEGTYLEVVPNRKVVFTWGGTEGLAPGQSTVEFMLEPVGAGTLLRLRHYQLPGPAVEVHHALVSSPVNGWTASQSRVKDRCEDQAVATELTEVGSYRFLG